jgi:hypothetical protein
MSYGRRRYQVRDSSGRAQDDKVEVVVLVNGQPHSRVTLAKAGMTAVLRKVDGYDIEQVEPNAESRVTDVPDSDVPVLPWQLEALTSDAG